MDNINKALLFDLSPTNAHIITEYPELLSNDARFYTFPIGHLLRQYILPIIGDEEDSRELVSETLGCAWNGAYPPAEALILIQKYNYKIIPPLDIYEPQE